MRYGLLAVVLVGFGVSLRAQVVNVERMRLDDTKPGWSGSVAGNLDLRQNQRSVFTAGLKSHLQLRRDSATTLLVAQGGLVKTDDNDFVNFAFAHLRHTRRLTRRLAAEAFTQLQQNRVNGIASRWLVGVGPRLRVFDRPQGAMYFGSLAMFEREEEVTDGVAVREHWRLSNYLAASYTPARAKWVTLTTTTYYQPRLDNWGDFRVASESNVQVSIGKRLALTTTFDLFYDARPPTGLDRTTYAFLNGIRWTFG